MDVRPAGRTIAATDLAAVPAGATRVLLRTPNSDRWARRLEFFDDFTALGLAAAEAMVRSGVRLVGIDSLSIEDGSDLRYPVHRALLGSGALILEGLLLDGTPPGRYELDCLPLRLRDGDGGPARAVLREAAPEGA